MKDGSTHLAHKAEHAVDMETGAAAGRERVRRGGRRHADDRRHGQPWPARTCAAVEGDARTAGRIHADCASEAVGDKGLSHQRHHGRPEARWARGRTSPSPTGARASGPSPTRPKQEAARSRQARDATYANRRRTRGGRGQGPDAPPGRGARAVVRPPATRPANMRRLHLRGRDEHRQAGAGPRRRVQPGAADAGQVRHAQAQERLRGRPGGRFGRRPAASGAI